MDKEFEKSKIYTAVNADELMAGDKVIVADNLADLRDKVMKDTEPDIIKDIRPDYNPCRFMVKGDIYYFGFAFLIERKENCTNCVHREGAGCKPKVSPINCCPCYDREVKQSYIEPETTEQENCTDKELKLINTVVCDEEAEDEEKWLSH